MNRFSLMVLTIVLQTISLISLTNAVPPERLEEADLHAIRSSQGKYSGPDGKAYMIWALKQDTQELDVMGKCPFLQEADVSNLFAVRVGSDTGTSRNFTYAQHEDSETLELPSVGAVLQAFEAFEVSQKFAAAQIPATCATEAANPTINPEIQETFFGNAPTPTSPIKIGAVIDTGYEILIYRLMTKAPRQLVNHFVLLHIGKGYVTSNPERYQAIKATCLEQLISFLND